MKKTSFYLALVLIAAIFTSCKMTMMKKHYRKGYYVEHRKNKANPDLTAKNKVTEKHERAVLADNMHPKKSDLITIEPAEPASSENRELKESAKGPDLKKAKK